MVGLVAVGAVVMTGLGKVGAAGAGAAAAATAALCLRLSASC